MTRRRAARIAVNAAALVVCFVFAFPVYWMLTTALQRGGSVVSDHPHPVPTSITLDNFKTAVTTPLFLTYLRNSLIVTLSAVLLALVVALLAAVAAARLNWRGRKAFLLIVIAVQLSPFEALLIPFFVVFRQYDLVGKLLALILVYFAAVTPFSVWMLRGFVAAVPGELEDAALVDGCSRLGAFLRVVFPLLGPGLAATAIFGFITAWNEFLYAFVFMQDRHNYTLPVWLAGFRSTFGTDWGATMAGSVLFTVPVLVFFVVVNRHMVSGLTSGAVKG